MSGLTLSSLSICGRLTLDMHSLNNEGGEGNQILTRQVTIVDKNGKFATVNAVSGDMLKHIQSEHFWMIASEEGGRLCSSCQKFDANRVTDATEFVDWLKSVDLSLFEKKDKADYEKLQKALEQEKDDAKKKEMKKELAEIRKNYPKRQLDILNRVIETCSLDDVAGILITNEGNNAPRKSCAEFGWLVGLPEATKTETFFHVKYAVDASSKKATEDEGANTGQIPFHRPANSGIYALVSNFDICRVGYNDISKRYSVDDTERGKRVNALLRSILYTFVKPKGAMRNTQNPHIVDFTGVITLSSRAMPAPTVSPINDDYVGEVKKVANSLNTIEKDAIEVKEFSSLGDFSEKFAAIVKDADGYKLKEV